MHKSVLLKFLQQTCYRNFSYKSVRRPNASTKQELPTKEVAPTKVANEASGANLTNQLKVRIMTSGPLSVADYMREVLTNPTAGYYMNRDVFGREGDFITSPEISQIFGELIAVWIVNEWQKLGSPTPFQLVELGPGRGTLARDVLKVLTQLKLAGKFSMHLVEISPFLSQIQAQRFCFKRDEMTDDKLPYYQIGETGMGTKAFWYRHLEDVPKGFSIVLAHEFFDALPIHRLQLDEGVWKEVLIDLDNTKEGEGTNFRFVLSKTQTPISKIYKPIEGETRTSLEWSPDADRIVRLLAERVESDGGIGLIMDYGHFGEKGDTFRAFKNHKLHDPLKEPGTADLTADVDFRHLKNIAEQQDQVICFGPVEQGSFLKRMEGDARLEQLLKHATTEEQETLKSAYKMLTEPEQMGARFKFLSMFPAVVREHLQKFPVHGFQ